MGFILALLANLFVGGVDAIQTSRKAKEYKPRSEEKIRQWNDYQKELTDIAEKVNSQYRNQFSK